MPNKEISDHPGLTQAQIMTAYMAERQDELLDAVVTASALVARADGAAGPIERSQLLDFLGRNGLLSVHTRAEILDAFEFRIRQFEERGGAVLAIDCLARLAGRSPARFVIGAGEHVAAADGHLHPDELRMLQLIRIALAPSASTL